MFNGLLEPLETGYYQPPKNNPTYDAMMYDQRQDKAVVFQATVGKRHDIKAQGINGLRTAGVKCDLIYILVTPAAEGVVNITVNGEVDSMVKQKYHIVLENILPQYVRFRANAFPLIDFRSQTGHMNNDPRRSPFVVRFAFDCTVVQAQHTCIRSDECCQPSLRRRSFISSVRAFPGQAQRRSWTSQWASLLRYIPLHRYHAPCIRRLTKHQLDIDGPEVMKQLVTHLALQQASNANTFYQMCVRYPATKTMAGFLLDDRIHGIFSAGGTWELRSLLPRPMYPAIQHEVDLSNLPF